MGKRFSTVAGAILLGAVGAAIAMPAAAQKSGGVLNFVVGSKIPTYDGHKEGTFGMVHPIAPFYSTLIRINPDNPGSTTDFVCDVCVGDVPTPTDDGLRYSFKLRRDVTFHNGQQMTSADVKATFDKIVNPEGGAISLRKAFFGMVASVSAPDDYTVQFDLKYPSGAFIPALAMPFNWIYSADVMKTNGMRWYEKNVMGTGPFVFVEHQPGSHVEGKRNANYFRKGQPYLDGFRAISAPKMATRLNAIRGGRALIEFRGFPPKAREDLQRALGDKIEFQESAWNCMLGVTINHTRKPLDDKRVRRALTLAVDRWGGSKYLSKIAIVKTVGGIVFPGHPFAATEEELSKIAGYGKDIEANRAEARRLLKEAGVSNLELDFINRAVDQPYKVVGTWLIDQWKKIGVTVEQRVLPSPVLFDSLRTKKDFDIGIDFNCQSIVNPLVDISKFLSADIASNNYGQSTDRVADELFNKMSREPDPKKQRALIREYEKRVLNDEAHSMITLWWHRIIAHSAKVKGWKISPSHYLNQDLSNVWIEG